MVIDRWSFNNEPDGGGQLATGRRVTWAGRAGSASGRLSRPESFIQWNDQRQSGSHWIALTDAGSRHAPLIDSARRMLQLFLFFTIWNGLIFFFQIRSSGFRRVPEFWVEFRSTPRQDRRDRNWILRIGTEAQWWQIIRRRRGLPLPPGTIRGCDPPTTFRRSRPKCRKRRCNRRRPCGWRSAAVISVRGASCNKFKVQLD